VTFSSLDLLRAYTAQFDGAEYNETDDKFLPHEPINAADAAELVRKWSTGSVSNPTGDPKNDRTWTLLQSLADDYGVPVDEFLGAVHFVSQHNGAYKCVPRLEDRIGCAMGEITRVLGAFSELVETDMPDSDDDDDDGKPTLMPWEHA
jgi:hypothetical protein